jgi:uncharacterized membrane protein
MLRRNTLMHIIKNENSEAAEVVKHESTGTQRRAIAKEKMRGIYALGAGFIWGISFLVGHKIGLVERLYDLAVSRASTLFDQGSFCSSLCTMISELLAAIITCGWVIIVFGALVYLAIGKEQEE